MTMGSEITYLRGRMRTSLAMAAAAAGPCAQIAHETLAQLYGEAIDALSARKLVRPLCLNDLSMALIEPTMLRHAKKTPDNAAILLST